MFEAPRKRTQHYWPTTPNIFGCYMLRPFALHVACCWELTCAKSETGQTIIISYVEMDATVLCLFARGLRTTASIPLSGKYIEKLLSLYLSAWLAGYHSGFCSWSGMFSQSNHWWCSHLDQPSLCNFCVCPSTSSLLKKAMTEEKLASLRLSLRSSRRRRQRERRNSSCGFKNDNSMCTYSTFVRIFLCF